MGLHQSRKSYGQGDPGKTIVLIPGVLRKYTIKSVSDQRQEQNAEGLAQGSAYKSLGDPIDRQCIQDRSQQPDIAVCEDFTKAVISHKYRQCINK